MYIGNCDIKGTARTLVVLTDSEGLIKRYVQKYKHIGNSARAFVRINPPLVGGELFHHH